MRTLATTVAAAWLAGMWTTAPAHARPSPELARADARPPPALRPASARPAPGLYPGCARPRPGLPPASASAHADGGAVEHAEAAAGVAFRPAIRPAQFRADAEAVVDRHAHAAAGVDHEADAGVPEEVRLRLHQQVVVLQAAAAQRVRTDVPDRRQIDDEVDVAVHAIVLQRVQERLGRYVPVLRFELEAEPRHERPPDRHADARRVASGGHEGRDLHRKVSRGSRGRRLLRDGCG